MVGIKGKSMAELTAADVMTLDPVVISEHMSLRAAAHLLAQARITGAPVIDSKGRCVGVLSSTDFVRYAQGDACRESRVVEVSGCMCAEWQIMEIESLPADEVGAFMTAKPVTAQPTATVVELARAMLEARIHRLIVVDEERHPIGIVSTTDLLAALAYAEPSL